MSDVGIASGTGIATATGIASFPVLAEFGIDPVVLIFGLAGCIAAQLLLPADGRTRAAIVKLTIGSILFCAITAQWCVPWALAQASGSIWQPVAVKSLCSAALGAFAQPLALLFEKVIISRARAFFGLKEEEA